MPVALPTLVALLMERASTTTVLLVSHLFTLACAALVLTLLLALLAPRIGWLAAAAIIAIAHRGLPDANWLMLHLVLLGALHAPPSPAVYRDAAPLPVVRYHARAPPLLG